MTSVGGPVGPAGPVTRRPRPHLPHGLLAGLVAVVVLTVAATLILSRPWARSSGVSGHSPLASPGGVAPGSAGPGSAATSTTAAPPALDPTAFAPGSCMALEPTSGDLHHTVFLDAGHGGPDPGTASGTTQSGQQVNEKTLTLPVVLDAAQLLRAQGYRVVLSRTGDSSVARLTPADLNGAVLTTAGEHADLIARVSCANLSGASALVSVHFDAYPDPGVGGASTLYDTARSFSSANQTLATTLQQDIITGLRAGGWSVPDRGIVSDSTAGGGEITAAGTAYGHLDLLGPVDPGYVDNPTTMPGALVEPLFLSNPTEATIAVNPAAQQAIAAGIADAIDGFLRTS